MQDTRTPLLVALAVNSLNAVLDPLLIFWADLGLAGAAVATVIAQGLGALVFLRLLSAKARREGWAATRIRAKDLRPFLTVGSVLVGRTVLLVSSLSLATAAAARAGTVDVAAHQVVSQIWFLLAMVVDALAIAAQAMVADLVGRGATGHARTLSNRLLGWGALVGVLLGILVWGGGSLLAALFTDDEGVRAAITSVTPIAGGMQPLAAVLFVFDGIFLAVLAVRRLLASTAAGFVATLGALGLSDSLDAGLIGVWWAIVAMVVARVTVLALRYRSPSTWARS
jgi:MATE family multidrug resistance protein